MKSNAPSPQENIWVLGGGQFGRRAVKLFIKNAPSSNIVLVDREPIQDMPDEIEVVCGEGVAWLTEHFTRGAEVEKIVPALPIHLVAAWIQKVLLDENRIVTTSEITDEQLDLFPHPFRLSPNSVAMSHADFLCPPNCLEPNATCTYTQKQRPIALYHLLEQSKICEFVPLILRSRQFAPGVGGFFPEDLWYILERAKLLPATPLLIGTACKCHGIVSGLLHTNQSL